MDPDGLERLNALSEKLVEAHKDWAFCWALEKKARADGLIQAWEAGYNSSRTSDHAFVQALDESINTVTLQADIKALEQEYAHQKFLLTLD